MSSSWVVLKFGGTSVATAARWSTIADIVQERLAEGLRPVVVCSALAGVSDALEDLLEQALRGDGEEAVEVLHARHGAMAAELGVDAGVLEPETELLDRLTLGISLTREASPKLRAQVMACGELMSTRLGAAWMRGRGLDVAWLDARDCLSSEPEPDETRHFLSARCLWERDHSLQQDLAGYPAKVLLTQGFIARDAQGRTVVLGRGGSDTSAATFAARLDATRCEIWTDVPGMFTANPRQVPEARLLAALDYDEAQEIASLGAKVLHPRALPPVRESGIPLHVLCTERPDMAGTVVAGDHPDPGPGVKAISVKTGLTLVSMDGPNMWQQVGFLADLFAEFKACGLSVDLVSTSEMNVTVSLDPTANALEPATLERLSAGLSQHCQVRTIGPCAAIGLVGRSIRATLHRLGPALAVFEEERIHLVSQAASDLNLTFVVDEDQADRLVQRLHVLLFGEPDAEEGPIGPSWRALFGAAQDRTEPWWVAQRDALLALAEEGTPVYVYDRATVAERALSLLGLAAVDRVLYAMKANPHPELLALLGELGVGFECVSPGELDRVFEVLPDLDPGRVLFTPNFAPRAEYAAGLARGVHLTLDNLHPLRAWPDVFAGARLLLRVDPGRGKGHHKHVRTAGKRSKFGVSMDELDEAQELIQAAGATVVGLHAHAGSGIRTVGHWSETAAILGAVAERFPDVEVLDLGGGLGVPEKPTDRPLDLDALSGSLARARADLGGVRLWLEPGRFLVAEAGVLLARVTQTKAKGAQRYVGIDAGMNSLIRPALYGAWHEIVNLTRFGEPIACTASVVGPICETGDTLGAGRRLPDTVEGDVLLIGTAGAYGRAMASHYNLRPPAGELLIGETGTPEAP